MSERIRINADNAEELALHIMNYACEVREETRSFVAYYDRNSDCWRDNKAQLFREQLINIVLHSNQATEAFYEYGDKLYEKVQELRS